MDLDTALHLIISQFTSVDKYLVNYDRVKLCAPWKKFLNDKKLIVFDHNILNKNETQKKCFFINLYNFLCIFGVCKENVLPNDVTKVTKFFDQELCILGKVTLSLDDILHGILRCNKPHPSSHTPFFSKDSPKLNLCLKTPDPRVLFALNSADRSSPPLRLYTATRLDVELTEACAIFLNPRTSVNLLGRSVVIPRVFLWYRKDFPGGHDVGTVRWISQFLHHKESDQVLSLMEDLENFGGVRIVHDSHDWTLNNLS